MMASAPSVQEQPLQPGTIQFRKQLAAAARSISWSYAIFWSISTRPGVLTWKDGSYNGEIKTRKIINSTMDLTADQLILQRSEQLRELYSSLLSGEGSHRMRRPITALSPDDLGDVEWYYVVCMTYAFRPGQCLPGKSFASNGCVWLCNAPSADSKIFPRKLLAKSASIKTIVCVPFMNGVLELGTTDPVPEDPNVVNRIAASFWEKPNRRIFLGASASGCSEEPSSSNPSSKETGDGDTILDDDLVHSSIIENMVSGEEEEELGDVVVAHRMSQPNNTAADLEQQTTTMDDIDEMIYSLCDEEMDVVVRSLEDNSSSLLMHPGPGYFDDQLVPASSPEPNVVSGASCFVAWNKRTDLDKEKEEAAAAAVAGGELAQKLLKKVVDGGAWINKKGRADSIKNHVISERRRREKLNEMFLILKSLVPSISKVDKASILAETIAYLKELEKRVEQLESSREEEGPTETRSAGRRGREIAGKKASAAKRKPPSEVGSGGGVEREHHHWSLSQPQLEGPTNVHVIVMDKELHLEMQCRWKELMMTRVFDAIKSLRLDVLSVQASAPDGLLGLKIRAKYASSVAVAPGMISEALRTAVGG